MSPAPGLVLLAIVTALVLAFLVAVLLDRPASNSRSGSSAAGVSAAASGTPSASGFDGAALPAGLRARDFTLTDQGGRPGVAVGLPREGDHPHVPLLDLRASLVLIAQQIRGALDELPHPVPVLIVSAEPAADTPRARQRASSRRHRCPGASAI